VQRELSGREHDAQRHVVAPSAMNESCGPPSARAFPHIEGKVSKHAWNDIDGDSDSRTSWSSASVVAQSRLGLLPHGWCQLDPFGGHHSVSSRPHLSREQRLNIEKRLLRLKSRLQMDHDWAMNTDVACLHRSNRQQLTDRSALVADSPRLVKITHGLHTAASESTTLAEGALRVR
jgi:hypothetical protein